MISTTMMIHGIEPAEVIAIKNPEYLSQNKKRGRYYLTSQVDLPGLSITFFSTDYEERLPDIRTTDPEGKEI